MWTHVKSTMKWNHFPSIYSLGQIKKKKNSIKNLEKKRSMKMTQTLIPDNSENQFEKGEKI